MAYWRRFLVAAIGALSLVGSGTVSAAAHEGGTLIEFDSMTGITGDALVGKINDRNIMGGGVAWAIAYGSGEVDRKGHVSVTVTDLVLAQSDIDPHEPC